MKVVGAGFCSPGCCSGDEVGGVPGDAEHLPPRAEGSRRSPQLSAEGDKAGDIQVFISGDRAARF